MARKRLHCSRKTQCLFNTSPMDRNSVLKILGTPDTAIVPLELQRAKAMFTKATFAESLSLPQQFSLFKTVIFSLLIIQTEHPQLKLKIIFLQLVWLQQKILKCFHKIKKDKIIKTLHSEAEQNAAYALTRPPAIPSNR